MHARKVVDEAVASAWVRLLDEESDACQWLTAVYAKGRLVLKAWGRGGRTACLATVDSKKVTFGGFPQRRHRHGGERWMPLFWRGGSFALICFFSAFLKPLRRAPRCVKEVLIAPPGTAQAFA
mmetsp:Transcript_7469/g.24667  ORF Transcript_7469/g.24667 Transcript_7469/m.24667 type:complete len:123 (-) Transcript_7469:628-996(-)